MTKWIRLVNFLCQMPELPEVETVALQLAHLVEGQEIKNARILDSRLGELPSKLTFVGASIQKVFRVGKQVILQFTHPTSPNPFYLAVHLRMTGRLLWRPANTVGAVESIPPINYVNENGSMKDSKYCRAVIHCGDGDLEFVDVRRFGTWKFSIDAQDFEPEGIDPLTPAFTQTALTKMLKCSQQNTKQWLLRQDRLVGLGNIYACEILFHAGISPLRPANALKPRAVKQLYTWIPKILSQAIEHCGTTFSDFQHTDGEQGSFQNFLKVYQREGKPCTTCGNPIARIVQNGRSTFYCPRCQR